MVDTYEFARARKRILVASKADPPRIDDVELDDGFVRFTVRAREDWLDEYDTLREAPAGHARSVVVGPVQRAVSWYQDLLEEVLDEHHLHVDVRDVDGEPALEVRCKHEWALERARDERTEASFVKLLVQTLGDPGTNERNDTPASPWYDVEDVPPDLRAEDLE